MLAIALIPTFQRHPATYNMNPFPGLVPYAETAKAIVRAEFNSWFGTDDPDSYFQADLIKGSIWRVRHRVPDPDLVDDSPTFFLDKASGETFLINRTEKVDHEPIRNLTGSDLKAINAAFEWVKSHAVRASQKDLASYDVSINQFEGQQYVTFDTTSGNSEGPNYNDGKGLYCTIVLDGKTLKVVKVTKL